MTLQEELRFYELALVDWEKSRGKDNHYKFVNHTGYGLCRYFNDKHSLFIYYSVGTLPILKALINQKAKGGLLGKYGFANPRITILKQAIEIVKQKIEDETL